MRIFDGKTYRDMTPEELTQTQAAAEKSAVEERKRHLTADEVSLMLITAQINTLDVDDQTALRMREFYPVWEDLCKKAYFAEKAGFKFTYENKLYKTMPPEYTFVSHYVPGVGTESLFERIDEQHDGSKYDPIPYEGNMVLTQGLHYTQNGITYICNRDTINPVYNALADLVGLYLEII